MLVLAIETSTAASGVCIATERGLVAAATATRTRHGEFLTPAVRFCLAHAGAEVGDLTGVAVSLGPGGYTGMRVGLATAQGLAHARRLPVVGVASLDLLAYPLRYVRRLLCAVIDARRGELFWACYRGVPGGVQRVTEYRVGAPEVLAADLEATGADVLCVGDGALTARATLAAVGADIASPATALPSPQALAELAVARFEREETQRPEELVPIYLRRPDARIGWAERGGQLGSLSTTAANPATSQETAR